MEIHVDYGVDLFVRSQDHGRIHHASDRDGQALGHSQQETQAFEIKPRGQGNNGLLRGRSHRGPQGLEVRVGQVGTREGKAQRTREWILAEAVPERVVRLPRGDVLKTTGFIAKPQALPVPVRDSRARRGRLPPRRNNHPHVVEFDPRGSRNGHTVHSVATYCTRR